VADWHLKTDWSLNSLREYLLSRIQSLENVLGERDRRFEDLMKMYVDLIAQLRRELTLALEASKEAVTKAENATEVRFRNVDRFRDQLAEQEKSFLTRNEYAAAHVRLEERLGEVTDRMNRAEGNNVGSSRTWMITVASIAAVSGVFSIVAVIYAVVSGR
jgi:hypothetical protein